MFLFFGPGVRYVPNVVWNSSAFWILLACTIVGILIYHNLKIKNNNTEHR